MSDPKSVNAMHTALSVNGEKSGMSKQSFGRHNATPSVSANPYLPKKATTRTEPILTRSTSRASTEPTETTETTIAKGHRRRHTRRMRKNRRRGRRGTRRR